MIDLRGKRRGVPSFGQRTRSRETLPIFSPLDTSSGLCVGHAPGQPFKSCCSTPRASNGSALLPMPGTTSRDAGRDNRELFFWPSSR